MALIASCSFPDSFLQQYRRNRAWHKPVLQIRVGSHRYTSIAALPDGGIVHPTAGAPPARTGQSGIVDTRRPPHVEQTRRPLASIAGNGRLGGTPIASKRSAAECAQ
ncbi:MAG: hypothetical protein KDJ20_07915 [Hyphomicrobiales bacterium]|nr:hypothetical protein [Hyphomicrobiales bacterium]MCC2108195.1 hypothetical protein [Hyphomicrobiales bacterium]